MTPPASEVQPAPSPFERRVLAGGAVLAGGLALAALVGPCLTPPWPGAILPGWGMSPGVAAPVLLLSLAVGVLRWHRSPAITRAAAIGAAGLLLLEGLADVLGPLAFPVQGAPPADAGGAHPSLPTTGSLLLTATVLYALARPAALSPRRWRFARVMAGVLAIFSGLAAGCWLVDRALLEFYGWSDALDAFLALTALNLAAGAAGGLWGTLREQFDHLFFVRARRPPEKRRHRRLLASALLAGTVLVTGLFLLNLSRLRREETVSIAANLRNLAASKAALVAAWRQERTADARLCLHSPFLADTLHALAARTATPTERARLATYLREFRQLFDYELVALFDRDLSALLTFTAESRPPGREPADIPRRLLEARDVVAGELHAGPQGEISLDWLVPLRTSPDDRFVGGVLLRADFDKQVLPLFAVPPLPSTSAEAMLYERKGDSAVFFHRLRFRPASSAQPRLPLTQTAAQSDFDQVTEGIDYRQHVVLRVAHPVPGSSWVVEVKVDKAEALAEVGAQVRLQSGSFLLSLVVVGLSYDAFRKKWRRDHEEHQRDASRKYQAAVERIDLMVQHTNDAILLCDEALQVVFANDRVRAIYGRSPAEMQKLTIWDLRAPDANASLPAVIASVQAMDGKVWESTHLHRDGTKIPVEISARMATIGGQRYFLAVIRDIAERQATEAKLRKLTRAIDQAPLGVLITDLAGTIEYANPKFTQMTGYAAAEVYGRNPRLLKSGHTPPEIYEDMWATLRRDQTWSGELHNRKKNGEVFVEAIVIAPVADERGLTTHYVSLKDDITVRRRMEAALAEVQDQYRLIAENAADTIWIYDLPRAVFTFLSPACQRLAGYSPPELVGRDFDALFSPESLHRIRAQISQRLAGFRVGDTSSLAVQDIFPLRHRDGHVVMCEVVSTLLPDATGRPTRILGLSRDVSERERNAVELRLSLERTAQAEHLAQLGHWQLDRQTNRFNCSEGVFPIFEYEGRPGTLTHADLLERVHPEDRERLEQAHRRAEEERRPYVLRVRLLFSAARIKHVLKCGQTFFDDHGAPLWTVGTVQDISRQVQIETELQESAQRSRLENEILVLLDERTLSTEDLLERVAELLPPAMPAPDLVQAMIVVDGATYTAGTNAPLAAQVTSPIIVHDRKIGAVTIGLARLPTSQADPMFSLSDRTFIDSIAHCIGLGLSTRRSLDGLRRFSADLERKVAERTSELEASNREEQALLQAIPDSVLRLREDGTVLFTQLAPGLAAEGGADQQLYSSLVTAATALGRRALAAQSTAAEEVEVGSLTGPVIFELRSAPTADHEFVVFARDITQRKRLEANVVSALAQERQVSEMKTRFISVTSHEFRTPMAAALGTLELLQHHADSLTPEKRNNLLGRLTRSLNRMTDMLEDILLLNRLDSGRLPVQIAATNLQLFVPSVIEEVRLADRNGHRFAFVFKGDTAHFPTDASQLHHILSNLLTNATRYSPRDSLVTTRLQVESDRAVLSVDDQGIGVPAEDRERIFAPFERGSNVGGINGTGLGLSIVKRIADALGGRIAYSVGPDGQGSCFTLELPRPAPAPVPHPNE